MFDFNSSASKKDWFLLKTSVVARFVSTPEIGFFNFPDAGFAS